MPGVPTRPAILADHLRQHVAQAQEHALHVDADHGVEHRFVIFGDRHHLALDAGIVEEAVDAAERVDRGLHIGLYFGRLGDVGGDGDRVAAMLAHDAGGGRGRRAVAIDRDHFRAMPCEGHAGRASDAVAAAGDECDLAGEVHAFLRWG
jgi:hypothetical protein